MGLLKSWAAARRLKSLKKTVDLLKQRTVKEIMTTYVITASPNHTVIHAATKMIAEDISCLVVMEGEKLCGILSERDFLRKVPLNKKVFNMHISGVMSSSVVTIPSHTKFPEAVALMKHHKFRRLVVVDEGKVVGIVTQSDFSKALLPVFEHYPVSDQLHVGAIMTKNVLTAKQSETFSKARDKMKKSNSGSVLIVDKDTPKGIFTEYDVVMQFYDQQGTSLTVKELSAYMRKYVRVTTADMNIFVANKLLNQKKIRRLPIVDGEKLVGIVTQTDIIRFVYLNLDKVVVLGEKEPLVKVPKEFVGEYLGDHLKKYV